LIQEDAVKVLEVKGEQDFFASQQAILQNQISPKSSAPGVVDHKRRTSRRISQGSDRSGTDTPDKSQAAQDVSSKIARLLVFRI
jgi:hypothetical protein